MTSSDDYLRALLKQAAQEDAFLDRIRGAENVQRTATATQPETPSIVSLMITNRQRAKLRELGFSDEVVRLMTPAEAHAKLGLSKGGL